MPQVTGEGEARTRVNAYQGNDPAQWQTGLATYEMVSLGEVYRGIEVKLKAYGYTVEKRFYVKPGAAVDAIQLRPPLPRPSP